MRGENINFKLKNMFNGKEYSAIKYVHNSSAQHYLNLRGGRVFEILKKNPVSPHPTPNMKGSLMSKKLHNYDDLKLLDS